jgi:hypothetical protein
LALPSFGGRPLPDDNHNFPSLARDLRARAEELLLRAEAMNDSVAAQKMREIAASYERLAQRVEQGHRGNAHRAGQPE